MRKAIKKTISILLVAVMVFGSAPSLGLVGLEIPEFKLFDIKAEAANSGTCGENLTWTFDKTTSTLTISGSGNMKNYNYESSIPWYALRSKIKTVKIYNGITSISNYAFKDCTTITDVYYLGDIAGWCAINFENSNSNPIYYANNFYINNSLITGQITIPESVTSIGDYAFEYCTEITSVTIGSNVVSVGRSAFNGCTGLTSITIPASVKSIDFWAFYNCTSINEVFYDGDIKGWCEIYFDSPSSNPVYYADSLYINGSLIEDNLIIPDGVFSIGDHAFENCTEITSVIIGDDVTSIGYSSFKNCTRLTSVTIGNSVKNIGMYAFENCTKLEKVIIGNSVKNIGKEAFKNCSAIIDVYYQGDIAGWCAINFDNSWSNPIYYADNFYINGSLIAGNLVIPDGVLSIGDYAFTDCSSLINLTIPDSVTSIGYHSFYWCSKLTNVTIGNGVTNIDDFAFHRCSKLTSVFIGDSITSIGDDAFSYCDNLSSVYYSGTKNQWKKVSVGTYNGNLTGNLIYECNSEKPYHDSGTCGDDLTWILYINGELVIEGTGDMTDYTYISDMPWFNKRSKIKTITIGDDVTGIGSNSFYYCTELTSVSIGSKVEIIGGAAFSNCSKLSTVYYPGTQEQWNDIFIGSKNDELIKNIVFDCYSERPYYMSGVCGNNLTWILFVDGELVISGYGDMADYSYELNAPWFNKRTKIKTVSIDERVTSIGDYAFYDCPILTSITIPKNIISIGEKSFCYCTSLTSITIPNNVTCVGNYAFDDCYNLSQTFFPGTQEQWTNISVGSNNNELTKNIIYECNSERPYYFGTCGDNLTWLLYTDGELIISGTGDMANYSSLSSVPWYSKRSEIKNVTISNGVTSIGNNAFYDCDEITYISIPESVKNVLGGNFSNCDKISQIEFLGYTVELSANTFLNSPNSVLFCKSGSSVQYYAERNNIVYILIDGDSANLAIKGNQIVFYNGNSATPKIPLGVTTIGVNSFKDNETVAVLVLPSSVSSIFSGAFSNCSALEEIFIPYTVTTIAADAFNGTNPKIVCYANSTAHQFAIDNGIDFELVEVTLNETSLVLKVGECSIITAVPKQEYINSTEMSWKSSNTNVATIDENGKVTAKSNGEAIISALAPNGATLATCSVNVIPAEAVVADVVKKPTQTIINYGDAIILHVDESKIPAGGRVEWDASNSNFSYSANGTTCEICPEKSGETIFTATIYDANGNEIFKDEQAMTSKAGFFDKLIAFFKKLFGLTKTIPQAFKGIF